jgi:diguanylate cyclase (GGDEF)-like protein
MQRARRAGWPLSLLILDADRFKQFNDRYGHGEGDEALKSIAQCIRTRLRRPTDTAFRIGGEEFAIILPETDLKGAGVVAEAVRHELRSLCIPHVDNTPGVMTVSVGMACTGPTAEAPASLFSRADAALYHAKENGRDRSCASELPAQVHRAA